MRLRIGGAAESEAPGDELADGFLESRYAGAAALDPARLPARVIMYLSVVREASWTDREGFEALLDLVRAKQDNQKTIDE